MYTIDSKKHFKIWFSSNPNSFLGIENQMRLIRMRSKNPSLTIHFVYSSLFLSIEAKNKLVAFCKHYNIIPFDFDAMEDVLKTDAEKALYQIAKNEIDHAQQDMGGNLGAASDCARLLSPILALGIYSDFDVDILVPEEIHEFRTETPFLMSITGNAINLTLNSDTIAVAVDMNNRSIIHPDALLLIQDLQNKIILNYSNPIVLAKSLLRDNGSAPLKWLEKHILENPNINIYDLRKSISHINFLDVINELYNLKSIIDMFDVINIYHLAEVDAKKRYQLVLEKSSQSSPHSPGNFMKRHSNIEELAHNAIVKMRHDLYSRTVRCVSGPDVLRQIFNKLFAENDFTTTLKKLECFGLRKYGLEKYFQSKNKPDSLKPNIPKSFEDNLNQVCEISDQSWNEVGKSQMQLRQFKMNRAARTIQRAYRAHVNNQIIIKTSVLSSKDRRKL